MTRRNASRIASAALIASVFWPRTLPADVHSAGLSAGGGLWTTAPWVFTPGFPPPPPIPPTYPDNIGTMTFHADIGDNAVTFNHPPGNVVTILSLGVGAGGNLTWSNAGPFQLNIDGGPINNAGQMSMNAGDFLGIGGNVSLSGNGNLQLTAADSTIVSFGGIARLTNQQLVHGRGRIGFSTINANITNDAGTISADVGGAVLQVQVQSDLTQVNGGVLRAENGGILLLNGPFIDNAGGTIEAQNGSTVQLNNDTDILGGSIKSAGSGQILIADSTPNRFDSLTIEAGTNVNLVPNADLNLRGTIVNNGTITHAVGPGTDIIIQGAVNLNGDGLVLMQDELDHHISFISPTGNSLTIGSQQTIAGAGDIGGGTNSIVNNGLVVADEPGQDMRLSGIWTNNSLVASASGGRLITPFSVFTNNGALLAQAGSHIVLNGTQVNGGTLGSTGSGTYDVKGATLRNTTSSALFVVDGGESFELDGTISNSGTFDIQDASDLLLVGDVLLTGGGTVKLGQAGNSQFASSGVVRTLANSNNTISGAGLLGNNTMSIRNFGTIAANLAGQQLSVDPPPAGQVENFIRMEAVDGGILNLRGGTFDNTDGGKIVAKEGSIVRIASGAVTYVKGTANAEIRAEANATVEVGGGATIDGVKLFTNSNAGQLDFGSRIRVTGSEPIFKNLTNKGFLLVDQGSAVIDNITNEGLIRVENQRQLSLQNTLTQPAGGLLEVVGTNTTPVFPTTLRIAGSTTISGAGEVRLSGKTDLGIRTALILGGNGTNPVLNNVSTITGEGRISGLVLNNMGTIAAAIDTPPFAQGIDARLELATLTGTNASLLEARANSALQINGGSINNTSGIIGVQGGGLVELTNGPTIRGGTLRGDGAGVVSVLNTATLLSPIVSTAHVRVEDGAMLTLTATPSPGTFANDGLISLNADASSSTLRILSSDFVISGLGDIVMTDDPFNFISAAGLGERLTLECELRGAGTVGSGLRFKNFGTVKATGVNQLILLSPDNNEGTMIAEGAGGLRIETTSGTFGNQNLLEVRPGSKLRVVGSLVNQGILRVDGDATVTTLRGQGSVLGNGTINGQVIYEGRIDPAPAGGSTNTVGTLSINGNLTQEGPNPLSTITFDEAILFAGGGATSDRIAVTGAATLAGSMEISFAPGFIGLPGDSSTVMTFASRTGDLNLINNTGFAGLLFNKLYTPTTLSIQLDGLDGDANLDGTVNIGDFALLAANFNMPGDWLTGDFDGDGTVNIGDFSLLAANFNQSVAAAPLRSSTPEPAATLLAASLACLRLSARQPRRTGGLAPVPTPRSTDQATDPSPCKGEYAARFTSPFDRLILA